MGIESTLVFLASVFLLFTSLKLSQGRVGFYLLLSSFIYLTNFAWIPLNWMASFVLGYDMLSEDIIIEGLWGSTAFYFCYVFGAYYFVRDVKLRKVTIYDELTNKVLIFVCTAFFLASIFGYVVLNGMSFSAGNYGQRLTSNAGNGIFMIFFFLFIPAALLTLMNTRSKVGLAIALVISIIGGMLVYFTLGGSRNVLAAGILGVVIIAQRLGMISLKSILFCAVLLISFVNYLAFVRYGQGLSSDILELAFRYLIDSLSPYDSFNKILEFYESGDEEFKSFDYVMAQFNPLIPRALWPEKPVVPMTNAYYFTETVLGIHAGTYIISPTLLGGVYIMGGWIGLFFGCCSIILLTSVFERLMFCKKPFWVLFSYTLLPFSFFMVRESIELFFNKGILMFFTLFFIWIVAMIVLYYLDIIRNVDREKFNN